ncbi:MAG: TetM/TetW/TetO/TetS family tetracycline resistance ribosomal protection protein [Clostridia bacterium]|nr:TetM/TetW/TetO/TetS family tetracycline resistance ribosomal protection protein [Clostridia bacterium]
MKRIVLGILAHVDSGKTTLSESFLYNSGQISRLGRVDHGDAFLDTDSIERDRGITIFSKQAIINTEDSKITLVDTPGHVDFSAEAERTMGILDYAVLVISGTDGVQSHTRTLWNLLNHYNIPTFIFVNKMDLPNDGKESILDDLKTNLSDGCLDFSCMDDEFYELAALLDNELMDEYLENASLSHESLVKAINSRKIFPCFFGSALKNENVSEFLDAVDRYTVMPIYADSFGARVYKITEDEKGTRLAHIKITGGSLGVKTMINGNGWSEKINEIRFYSGDKFKSSQECFAGDVCAVTGLSRVLSGDGLGSDVGEEHFFSEPVFTYSVRLPSGMDVSEALPIFKKLEQEESQMQVTLSGFPQKINIRIMGEIQLEVMKRILSDRFSLDVEFEQGTIIYKETIANTVEGVGHYEPLRHYSEVHLLLEPGKRGSGLVFQTKCSEDVLARNWQRLIMTHLEEKTHLGVLTGSPITDMKITLINGRAHQKHTEGGDFRQSTYRAVRQGLMQADSVLLEPYYSFVLEIPTEQTGRALTDFQKMNADFEAPVVLGDITKITGKAPVSAIRDYHREVISYTHGTGRLSLSFNGYEPCKNSQYVIDEIGYECESDMENTADSVFCAHGAGFVVKWNEVFDYMHIPLLKDSAPDLDTPILAPKYQKIVADDNELLKIFEQTYGKQKEIHHKQKREERTAKTYKSPGSAPYTGKEYLLVDGYNIIFAWDELSEISKDSPDAARAVLTSRLCNYQAVRRNNVILVFDAYKVKGNVREIERVGNVSIVYTKEAETADEYIEKTSKELSRNYRVRVATSDGQVQMIVFGNNAVRVTAPEFIEEIKNSEKEIRQYVSKIIE